MSIVGVISNKLSRDFKILSLKKINLPMISIFDLLNPCFQKTSVETSRKQNEKHLEQSLVERLFYYRNNTLGNHFRGNVPFIQRHLACI